MSAPAVYEASPIKPPRIRATKMQVESRRAALHAIVAAMHPMSVRQVFYQASVHNLVEKNEAGYAKVQTDLVAMRRAGTLPYGWLADSTRWMRKPHTWNNIDEALEDTARLYRKSLWRDARTYVEIWLEKDALAGVVSPVTYEYDVPLMVARGYSSLSFLSGAAEALSERGVPAYIYHLGDYDPSGVNAAEKIEQTLRELAPTARIHFQRIGVTPLQITEWNLPTRLTKTSDTRSKKFGTVSVDLDAIEPDTLRNLVRLYIEQHLPPNQLRVLKVAEQSEREFLTAMIGQMRGDSA